MKKQTLLALTRMVNKSNSYCTNSGRTVIILRPNGQFDCIALMTCNEDVHPSVEGKYVAIVSAESKVTCAELKEILSEALINSSYEAVKDAIKSLIA